MSVLSPRSRLGNDLVVDIRDVAHNIHAIPGRFQDPPHKVEYHDVAPMSHVCIRIRRYAARVKRKRGVSPGGRGGAILRRARVS